MKFTLSKSKKRRNKETEDTKDKKTVAAAGGFLIEVEALCCIGVVTVDVSMKKGHYTETTESALKVPVKIPMEKGTDTAPNVSYGCHGEDGAT